MEKLSCMNHPDGNCPLCLYPLVLKDSQKPLPFMKLMSCYHCFHRWDMLHSLNLWNHRLNIFNWALHICLMFYSKTVANALSDGGIGFRKKKMATVAIHVVQLCGRPEIWRAKKVTSSHNWVSFLWLLALWVFSY